MPVGAHFCERGVCRAVREHRGIRPTSGLYFDDRYNWLLRSNRWLQTHSLWEGNAASSGLRNACCSKENILLGLTNVLYDFEGGSITSPKTKTPADLCFSRFIEWDSFYCVPVGVEPSGESHTAPADPMWVDAVPMYNIASPMDFNDDNVAEVYMDDRGTIMQGKRFSNDGYVRASRNGV